MDEEPLDKSTDEEDNLDNIIFLLIVKKNNLYLTFFFFLKISCNNIILYLCHNIFLCVIYYYFLYNLNYHENYYKSWLQLCMHTMGEIGVQSAHPLTPRLNPLGYHMIFNKLHFCYFLILCYLVF